ncbi:MAG: MBL fold metallo-hydrolase [Bacteroidaceae bacterium]|jgi:glyoxylase-like metal-dependent hydrolase (beta-lactamase superfamily II)|nr:MBL fold metallo-hydrolase [Bacteroidaceae bacterium]MDO4951034.1 MBL fold metallo-hydrolase [Bacteroidales bacterium]MBR3373390.1 MBL fold metallo-hydrolase [Bacteroidaceae bacterium]MBR3634170.1 MBL fold metallo-hydrolase [Bacteroidaceae bacterium]MBR4649465.1 MBL fold metallo-hydrolase [Bacteroidaceae bacterium]
MLNIKCFVVNMVEENCYVVSDETKEAVIIDDGAYIRGEHEAIDDYISRNGLTLTHVLNTHAHFDHTMGNAHLYRTYGLKPEISTGDAELYTDLSLQVQSILGRRLKVETVPLAPTLKEGDIITFGTHKLRVIETPGHTPGGICFYCREEAIIFSGDNLFEQSIGRTDFPGGNAFDLISSLQNKVMTLPDNTVVYPGHGGSTTIELERRYNPFLK